MRLNPVLRNESKLSVRTPRFSLMILIYVSVLTIAIVEKFMLRELTHRELLLYILQWQ